MMDANLGDGCLMVPTKEFESIDLPPGFRFHPTDEEIITYYLSEKVVDVNFSCVAIGEVDLNKNEPWDLPSKATMGEKEWYFFCQKDRKYPTGMRTNRATESGYWKATGKDKEIFKGKGCLVGMKKTLVFYKGRAPKGEKTNWVMHEYRLEGKASHWNFPRNSRDEWAVCRVFHKTTGLTRPTIESNQFHHNPTTSPYGDDQFSEPSTLPPLMESPYSVGTTSSYGEPKMMNTSMDQYQQNLYYNTMASSSNFYPQNNTFNMDYSHQGQVGLMNTSHNSTFDVYGAPQSSPSPLRRYCKVEQYSNQPMINTSPETSYDDFNNGQVSTQEPSTTLEEFNSLLKY